MNVARAVLLPPVPPPLASTVGVALLLGAGCLYAPAQEGYRARAPESGPTKLAPDGYRWVKEGGCALERVPGPYSAQGEEVEQCDFRLVRDPTAPPAGAAPGCAKDTDCKGDRICEASKCVYPER